jgi:hypothetical protein
MTHDAVERLIEFLLALGNVQHTTPGLVHEPKLLPGMLRIWWQDVTRDEVINLTDVLYATNWHLLLRQVGIWVECGTISNYNRCTIEFNVEIYHRIPRVSSVIQEACKADRLKIESSNDNPEQPYVHLGRFTQYLIFKYRKDYGSMQDLFVRW